MLDLVEGNDGARNASDVISASSRGFGPTPDGKSEGGAKATGAKLQFNRSSAVGSQSVVGADGSRKARASSDLIPGDELNHVTAQPESWKAFGEEPYDEAVVKSGNFAGRRQRLSPTTSKPNPGAFFNKDSGHKRDCQSNQ